MRFSNVFGIVAVSSVAVAALLAGCSDGGSGGEGGSAATSTNASTGATMGPPCEPKGAVCKEVGSDCIALKDNATGSIDLRMAQLTITEPAVLAKGVVANIVANGVQMNLEECNLAGGGTFSWILSFDPATKMVKTGGAKPVADPSTGYCFVNEMLGGKQISPITVDSALADGKFKGSVNDINVPIYLDANAMSYVLMPLHAVVLDGTISSDNNCIGKYNADTLDPKANCLAEPPEKLAFTNGGTLNGYITLEEADTVIVDTLKQSLCVLLSGNPAMYGDGAMPAAKCKRDAMNEIVYQGGWCAMSNAAATADCADAEKLGAQYAASAVKVNGDCQ
jgi:hypothetical protein